MGDGDRYRALVEQTSDWLWEVDADAVYVYSNPRIRDLLGYEPDEILGKTPFDLMPPEEAERVMALFGPIAEAREPFDRLENTNLHRDGRPVVLETSGVPIFDEGGAFRGYRGIDRVITERKRVEEELARHRQTLEQRIDRRTRELRVANDELRESEAKLRVLLETVPDPLYVIDQDTGQILDVNDAAVGIYGYSREEWLTLKNTDVSAEPDQTRAATAELPRKIPVRYHRRKDGSVFPLEMAVGSAVLDGRRLIIATGRDITDRLAAEERLHRSEAEFRTTFERSLDAIVWANPETGLITRCNRAAEALLGCDRTELIGQHQTLMHPPADRDHYAAMFRQHIEQDGAFEDEAEVITAGGQVVPVSITASLAEVGGTTIIQGVIRDISDSKRADEQIRAQLREKEVLLHEIHHRVKNNLQVISSLLNLQAREVDEPAEKELFRESKNRVRAMALPHEQLYRSEDVARVDLGNYARDLATGLARSYRVEAGAVAVRVDVGEIRLPLDAAIPCGLIITELVSNCLKHAFGEAGRGEVVIALQGTDGGRATLSVTDDGRGFPEELDFRKTRSLGLQLVVSLAEQLGGTLEMERRDGTEFRVTFPV